MEADGGGGAAPSPASHGHASGVSNRASTALAAVSVFLILLYLFWRFVWQYLKHERRGSGATSAAAAATSSSSSASPPSCPSRDGVSVHVAGEAARRTPRATTTTSSLPVFVRVAAGFGAEKVDCAVCLAELGDDGEPAARLVPGCGHGFHAECIEAWFRVNSTCPLCRAAVQSAGEAPPRQCSSV